MATKNFTDKELSCRCGCGAIIEDEVFLHNLQRLRDQFGFKMPVTSGKRCADYNEKVSKTGRTGPHVVHSAVDIRIFGERSVKLIGLAYIHGFDGIGSNQKGPYSGRFIHLDRRIHPWHWTY